MAKKGDDSTISDKLKAISEEKGWDEAEFLDAILDALETTDANPDTTLSDAQSHAIIDYVDEQSGDVEYDEDDDDDDDDD
jgi:hypothetical protein